MGCKWVPIGVFGFLILVHFISQTNYVACHSSSFYQVLGRPNDPKNMGLASLVFGFVRHNEVKSVHRKPFEGASFSKVLQKKKSTSIES